MKQTWQTVASGIAELAVKIAINTGLGVLFAVAVIEFVRWAL